MKRATGSAFAAILASASMLAAWQLRAHVAAAAAALALRSRSSASAGASAPAGPAAFSEWQRSVRWRG